MNFLPVSRVGRDAGVGDGLRGGDWAVPAVLAVVAWLMTYNEALMRGDDVNHLSVPYGSQVFLPNLVRGWIPNRVLDLYGRNLLARVFDLTFFPAHELAGVDFFHWYKIFSATLFTVFLLVVYRAVMTRIGPQPGALVSVFTAFALLLLLPWTNQVRAVCYELPSFLLYVSLAEIFALLRGKTRPAPWLLPVGFMSAFSLEAYAAILVGALALVFVLARLWRVAKFWRSEAAVLGGLIVAFCIVALVTTAVLGQRVAVSETLVALRQYAAYLKGGPFPPAAPVFYAQMLAIGVAGLAAMCVFRRRFVALGGFSGIQAAAGWPQLGQKFADFAIVACVTLVVVALISIEANQNFFWFRSYPWGGLAIPAMLFGLTAAASAVAAGSLPPLVDSARVFIVAIAVSRMAVAAVGQAAVAYDESQKVQAAYAAVVHGANGVVDTGLDLDDMEMPKRVLPTADSPLWFIDGYRELLLKYYGVWSNAVFR